MATLAALQRRTATLAQEVYRQHPAREDVLDWLLLFSGDEQDQVKAFLAMIEPRLGTLPGGALNLSGITDDELDELARWANLAKKREDESKRK